MRIAISTDNGFVSAHFGRCPSFTLIDIEDGKAINKEELPNPGHEPGAIPEFLHGQGVNCIVAGGMGMRAETFFSQYGIQTVVGISGKVDDIIKQFKQGIVKSGESLCKPGAGKGYGLDKQECDHPDEKDC